jgi:membrane-associated phospholipid phosphatase
MNLEKPARLISAILNPYTVSPVTVLLICLHSNGDIGAALFWAALAIALSVLPVLGIILWLVRRNRLEGVFVQARRQRSTIYLLAIVCIGVSIAVLYWLGAPAVLIAAFLAGFLAMTIYMLINLRWKISVHTGFIATAAALLLILYGVPALAGIPLLFLVGWSRVALGKHSTAQVIAGAIVAPLTVLLVFVLSGLL